MKFIIDIISDPIVLFVLLTLVLLLVFTIIHFQVNINGMLKSGLETALEYRLRSDNIKTKKREQLSKMGKKQNIYVRKYYMAVSSIKIALGLTFLTVENFTTLFLLFGLIVWVIASILLNNAILGFLVAVPSIFAFLAFLLVITKKKIRANDNAVMDALDAICPTISMGVVNAIKLNRESYSKRIAHHFEWFLGAIEFKGYTFDEAIDELSNRLGPRFYEFSHKAKIFEEFYKEGMEDIFKDIVEQNNDVRTDNAELDEIFRKKNQDLLVVATLMIAFLGYMYMIPLTREFMVNSFLGTLTAALEVSMLILIYAISQLMQVDLPEVEEERLGRK